MIASYCFERYVSSSTMATATCGSHGRSIARAAAATLSRILPGRSTAQNESTPVASRRSCRHVPLGMWTPSMSRRSFFDMPDKANAAAFSRRPSSAPRACARPFKLGLLSPCRWAASKRNFADVMIASSSGAPSNPDVDPQPDGDLVWNTAPCWLSDLEVGRFRATNFTEGLDLDQTQTGPDPDHPRPDPGPGVGGGPL